MAIQTPSFELSSTLVQPTVASASRGYWREKFQMKSMPIVRGAL